MARILKTGIQSHFDDAAPGGAESLFGALYSLQQHIPVRSVPRAPSEQLGKVVRAHAGNRSKLRQAEIFRQVVSNMIKNTLETVSWQASLVGNRCVAAHGVTIEQIYGKRVGQGFAVYPSRRRSPI